MQRYFVRSSKSVNLVSFKDMKAPGNFSIFPEKVVSGTKTRLEIRYINSNMPLPCGSYFRLLIEPLSVKTLFHCPPSEDFEIIPFKGSVPDVTIENLGLFGIGFRNVKIAFPKGLAAGSTFAVLFGNKQPDGSIIATINPVPVKHLTFETYCDLKIDPENSFSGSVNDAPWSQRDNEFDFCSMAWHQNLPFVEVLSGPASALRMFAPSLIETSSEFDLRIAVTDDFDSRCEPVYEGKVEIQINDDIVNLPCSVKFTKDDRSSILLRNLQIDKPGIYRIKAALQNSNKIFESNPVVVRENLDSPLYWGNIHNHSFYSEDWGDDLDTFFSFAREISGMDFVGISDHLYYMPYPHEPALTPAADDQRRLHRWRYGEISGLDAWKDTIAKADKYDSLEDFVTLVGYEWSSLDAHHYNIYFTDTDLVNLEKYFTSRYSDYSFTMRKLLTKTNALFIPHTHAWDFPYNVFIEEDNAAGKPLSPCMEVYSDWGDSFFPQGCFEEHSRFGGLRGPGKNYLWALENGFTLAAVADSDSHTGLPGRRIPGGLAPIHDHPQGLTAVRSVDFTRQGIINAYHNRNTYGTTGERIFLEVVANGIHMGRELRTDDNFNIKVAVAGTDIIEKIMLFKGQMLLEEKSLAPLREGTVEFKDISPTSERKAYVVAVIQKDENRAYSSPIWVKKKTIKTHQIKNNFIAYAIETKEPSHDLDSGFIWTTVRGDTKTIFHYRWHGQPLKADIKISGVISYEVSLCRGSSEAELIDNNDGNFSIEMPKSHLRSYGRGFDIITHLYPDKPARVTIDYDKSITTHIGNESVIDTSVKISLNRKVD